MHDDLPPTGPFERAPGDGFAPSASLPGPHGHLRLTEFLGGKGGNRHVYRATTSRNPDQVLVVELLLDEPDPVPTADQTRPRYALDLHEWRPEGWPPLALVTALPVTLPPPYQRIELQDFIGIGGMGQVWMARSPDYPDQALAVKFMTLPHDPQGSPFLAQFVEEVKAGLQVTHEFIVRTHQLLNLGHCVADGWPPVGLVMQRHEVSLGMVLADLEHGKKQLPGELAVRWSRMLLQGLEAFHRKNRVHRDVKPSNVLLALADGARYYGPDSVPDALVGSHALLSDLGTVCNKGTEPIFPLGQDGFKAPELFHGVHTADPAEDLFGFGKVLGQLAKVVAGGAKWLEEVAADCTQAEPPRRPRAADLFLRLTPDWDQQVRLMREAGHRPEEHGDFEGRQFIIRDQFEPFAQACGGHGGVFVVEAAAGVGKSALLTNWELRTGQPFGFYFRYRDNRTRAEDMPDALARQLCHRFRMEFRKPDSEEGWTAHLERLCADARNRPDAPERLLLFIDGLDEADDPARAVGFTPKALPAGTFVIASTRPPAKGKDHLALLRTGKKGTCRIYTLRADDPNNLGDVRAYLARRLEGKLAESDAQLLARNTGGIFLLARLLVEAIQAEQLSVADALRQSQSWASLDPSQRLFAYYRESWERICADEDEESLGIFAGLMAAAFTWIGEEQLERILGWYERELLRRPSRQWTPFRLRAVLRLLSWFLERRDGPDGTAGTFYQIRHQSVRDYLLSPEGPVPPSGLKEIHAAVGNYYWAEAGRDGWCRLDPYGRFFAVRHLLAAGNRESVRHAAELLADLDYLQGTLGDVPPDAAGE
jgi:hypothetical protein